MKRVISLFLSLALLLSLCTGAFATTNATLAVTGATDGKVKPGDVLTITATVPAYKNFTALSVILRFNTAYLEVTSLNLPTTVAEKVATIPETPDEANSSGVISLVLGESKNFSMTEPLVMKATVRVKSTAAFGTVNDIIKVDNEKYYVTNANDDELPTYAFVPDTISLTITAPATALTGTQAITGVTTPVKGATASTAVTAPANTKADLKWYQGSTVFTGTYAAATTYKGEITISPNSGYVFADGVSFTVNGEAWNAAKQSDGSYKLTKTFTTTAKDRLTGSITFSGEPKIGEALTATVTGLNEINPDNLTYTWYRGDKKITTASGMTYIPQKEDYQKILKFEVAPKDPSDYGGSIYAVTVAVGCDHAWNSSPATGECTKCGTKHDCTDFTYTSINGTQHNEICSVCLKATPKNHTASSDWVSDSTGHWHVCTQCNAVVASSKTDHNHNGTNGACSVCGYGCPHSTKNFVTGSPAATCCAEGVKDHYVCDACGTKFLTNAADAAPATTEDLTAPKIPHTFSTLNPQFPATCITPGKKAYKTCTQPCCASKVFDKDGNEITDGLNIPALGHDYTKVAEVPATCTTNGTKAHRTCSRCPGKMFALNSDDEVTSASLTIPALGHLDPIYVERDGQGDSLVKYADLKCSRCNEIVLDPIEGTSSIRARLNIDVFLQCTKAADSGKFTTPVIFAYQVSAATNPTPFPQFTGNFSQRLSQPYSIIGTGAEEPIAFENLKKQLPIGVEKAWTIQMAQPDSALTGWTIDDNVYRVYFTVDGNGVLTPVYEKRVEKQIEQGPTTDAGASADPTEPVPPTDPQFEFVRLEDPDAKIVFNNTFKVEKKDDPTTPVIPEGPKHTNRRYPAKPAASTDTKKPDGVNSARTFDAGVALYVGMSVLSLTGTALVIGKKKEF